MHFRDAPAQVDHLDLIEEMMLRPARNELHLHACRVAIAQCCPPESPDTHTPAVTCITFRLIDRGLALGLALEQGRGRNGQNTQARQQSSGPASGPSGRTEQAVTPSSANPTGSVINPVDRRDFPLRQLQVRCAEILLYVCE